MSSTTRQARTCTCWGRTGAVSRCSDAAGRVGEHTPPAPAVVHPKADIRLVAASLPMFNYGGDVRLVGRERSEHGQVRVEQLPDLQVVPGHSVGAKKVDELLKVECVIKAHVRPRAYDEREWIDIEAVGVGRPARQRPHSMPVYTKRAAVCVSSTRPVQNHICKLSTKKCGILLQVWSKQKTVVPICREQARMPGVTPWNADKPGDDGNHEEAPAYWIGLQEHLEMVVAGVMEGP
eukprot:CAMPEP_0196655134 /NCGR_PEP_ID=MMETSP1086-20130531/4879_1 /TAXON_ID=77921 /ORGANISM="Cyanoptyche  gloeocystis , Strain SAG4.97" /LENGTH=234 /DNA_ID=CAMNT_0041987277 /DNA_START=769 /DNA_END=1469 /DNA_ORIENTATION=+